MACQPCGIFILGQIKMTEKYCLAGLVKLVGRFLYCILRLTSFGNVEIVSLLDMPTQCALYSVSVTLQQ